MVEMLYLVIGLMIVMAAIPVVTTFALALAIAKRYVMRFHDPVEKCRFRVRLGGNVAYFVALLNAIAVLYYFVAAGIPLGARFEPWLFAAAQRLPEAWYIATVPLFLLGGFLLKVLRWRFLAVLMLLLFLVQVALELAPTLFELARDPSLFARFFDEIARMRETHANVGGIPGTVMGIILTGLVYGIVIQLAYYVLAITAFAISLQGAVRHKHYSAHRFHTA